MTEILKRDLDPEAGGSLWPAMPKFIPPHEQVEEASGAHF
jgi:hypothetical protein